MESGISVDLEIFWKKTKNRFFKSSTKKYEILTNFCKLIFLNIPKRDKNSKENFGITLCHIYEYVDFISI